jgi:hypothetical protein
VDPEKLRRKIDSLYEEYFSNPDVQVFTSSNTHWRMGLCTTYATANGKAYAQVTTHCTREGKAHCEHTYLSRLMDNEFRLA